MELHVTVREKKWLLILINASCACLPPGRVSKGLQCQYDMEVAVPGASLRWRPKAAAPALPA